MKEGISMKKAFVILLAALMAFSVAGCGSGKGDNEETFVFNGELFGPVKIGGGEEDVFVGVDTSFVHIFKASDKDNPSQSFSTTGFDDVENSAKSIVTDDVNFDGYADITIPCRRAYDLQYYYVYLYNPDGASFSFVPELSSIGDLTVEDGFLKGIAEEHGAFAEMKYYWKDGSLEEEQQTDESMRLALECASSLLGKDGLTGTFARDELIDMTISKLYFVCEGNDPVAYAAVSYDLSRIFYSELSGVYFEVVKDGDGYKKVQSYSKLEYEGVPYGYPAKGRDSLNDNQKEYYDIIAEKLVNFDPISIESPDAAAAMTAYLADHPVCSLVFRAEIEGYSVKGEYYYSWAPYESDISKDVMSEKMNAYSGKIADLVSQMPTGLEPMEKYVYLAQKLRLASEEEHHEGVGEDGLAVFIPGETVDERAAKTFAYMCEKAELYCTWSSDGTNEIMDGEEKKTVSVYETYAFPAGSDEWFSAFYKGENK